MKRSLVLLASVVGASAKDAFVFLGATGDNALRPSGVWQGLYETFAGGVMTNSDIHVAMHAEFWSSHDSIQTLQNTNAEFWSSHLHYLRALCNENLYDLTKIQTLTLVKLLKKRKSSKEAVTATLTC